MTHDPTSAAPDALQFDHAVPGGAAALTTASDAVPCSACLVPVGAEYWDVGGRHVCGRCRDVAARETAPVRETRLVLRAALFGLGAAIAGAAVYYGVIAITEFEIGIVAILIGWMVGRAVRAGARGRGGRRLQVLAVALTYVSVGLAYLPLATQGSAAGVESALGVGLLLAFALALPVMAIAGSMPSGLISALIIGIGMHQAWGMTGAAPVAITGPYRVASRRDGPDAARSAEPAPAT